jgi:hypothetical protein
MAFVKFTDPNGAPVWVGGHWVTQLKVPPRDQYHDSARTLLVLGTREQAVRETPEQVIAMLEGHDADA